MKDLERKIEKLEQMRDSKDLLDEQAIWDYLDSENVPPLERIGIMMKLGLLEPRTVIEMIMEANKIGAEKNRGSGKFYSKTPSGSNMG